MFSRRALLPMPAKLVLCCALSVAMALFVGARLAWAADPVAQVSWGAEGAEQAQDLDSLNDLARTVGSSPDQVGITMNADCTDETLVLHLTNAMNNPAVTLDLNQHELTLYTLDVQNNLTIKNGTLTLTRLNNTNVGSSTNTLTLENVRLQLKTNDQGDPPAFSWTPTTSVELRNSTFNATGCASPFFWGITLDATSEFTFGVVDEVSSISNYDGDDNFSGFSALDQQLGGVLHTDRTRDAATEQELHGNVSNSYLFFYEPDGTLHRGLVTLKGSWPRNPDGEDVPPTQPTEPTGENVPPTPPTGGQGGSTPAVPPSDKPQASPSTPQPEGQPQPQQVAVANAEPMTTVVRTVRRTRKTASTLAQTGDAGSVAEFTVGALAVAFLLAGVGISKRYAA